jgi:hypothetical protein
MVTASVRKGFYLLIKKIDRKTQTTKDLTKPWVELAQSSSPSRHSTPRSSPRPSSPRNLQDHPSSSHRSHSALTTLLLDDSPLKATLQPYNHVCIHEYDSSLRVNDLQILQQRLQARREGKAAQMIREKMKREEERQKKWEEGKGMDEAGGKGESQDGGKEGKKKKKRKAKMSGQLIEDPEFDGRRDTTEPLGEQQIPLPEADNAQVLDRGDDAANGNAKPSSKRKRDDETPGTALSGSLEDTELMENADSPSETKPARFQSDDGGKFDQTLLAVIGVLDALRLESNVAGWIRHGKLWASSSKSSAEATLGVESSEVRDEHTTKKQKKRGASIELETGADGEGEAAMWFTDVPTMEHWAGKGKEALEALGIILNDGVER